VSVFQSNVSDDELAAAFAGTNFGPVDHRKHLEQCVLQRLVGYGTGYTSTQIMSRLGLIDGRERVTIKGKRFLFAAFYNKGAA
jgi:hypothetical protein